MVQHSFLLFSHVCWECAQKFLKIPNYYLCNISHAFIYRRLYLEHYVLSLLKVLIAPKNESKWNVIRWEKIKYLVRNRYIFYHVRKHIGSIWNLCGNLELVIFLSKQMIPRNFLEIFLWVRFWNHILFLGHLVFLT